MEQQEDSENEGLSSGLVLSWIASSLQKTFRQLRGCGVWSKNDKCGVLCLACFKEILIVLSYVCVLPRAPSWWILIIQFIFILSFNFIILMVTFDLDGFPWR